MANIWLCHVLALLFVVSGIVQAESPIRRNNHELQQQHHNAPFTDYERKDSDVWNAPSSLKPHGKQRTTFEEEGDEAASAYLEALAGDGEKRGKESFRGDLGKRTQPVLRGAAEQQPLPVFWAPGKRFKVISRFRGDLGKRFRGDLGKRFRGDLGKRGKSSFKGDLGKRQFPFATTDDLLEDNRREFETNDSYRSKFGDDQTEQMVDAMAYKDRGTSP